MFKRKTLKWYEQYHSTGAGIYNDYLDKFDSGEEFEAWYTDKVGLNHILGSGMITIARAVEELLTLEEQDVEKPRLKFRTNVGTGEVEELYTFTKNSHTIPSQRELLDTQLEKAISYFNTPLAPNPTPPQTWETRFEEDPKATLWDKVKYLATGNI
jgi:hypothetical protein